MSFVATRLINATNISQSVRCILMGRSRLCGSWNRLLLLLQARYLHQKKLVIPLLEESIKKVILYRLCKRLLSCTLTYGLSYIPVQQFSRIVLDLYHFPTYQSSRIVLDLYHFPRQCNRL